MRGGAGAGSCPWPGSFPEAQNDREIAKRVRNRDWSYRIRGYFPHTGKSGHLCPEASSTGRAPCVAAGGVAATPIPAEKRRWIVSGERATSTAPPSERDGAVIEISGARRRPCIPSSRVGAISRRTPACESAKAHFDGSSLAGNTTLVSGLCASELRHWPHTGNTI